MSVVFVAYIATYLSARIPTHIPLVIDRLMVTGSWAADLLRDEYRWRLGLFRDYLKVEQGKMKKKKKGAMETKGGRRRPSAYDDEEGDYLSEEDSDDDDDDYYYDGSQGGWR